MESDLTNTNNNDMLKIAHNEGDFVDGQSYILTMKDQSVLDNDDVNQAEDQMENSELQSDRNLKQFKKAKAKLNRGNMLSMNDEYDEYGNI